MGRKVEIIIGNIRIMSFRDTHYNIKPPYATRIGDYHLQMMMKTDEILDIARLEKPDVIIHDGDVFHYPAPEYEVLNDVMDKFEQFEAPIFVNPGNHDMLGDEISSLKHTGIGALEKSKKLTIFRDRSEYHKIEKDGLVVSISGTPFNEMTTPAMLMIDKPMGVHFSYHSIHHMLIMEKFNEMVKYTSVKEILDTQADITSCGHVHIGMAPVLHEGKLFITDGSIARLRKPERAHQPKVTIIDISPSGVEYRHIYLKNVKYADALFSSTSRPQQHPTVADGQPILVAGDKKSYSIRVDVPDLLEKSAGKLGVLDHLPATVKMFGEYKQRGRTCMTWIKEVHLKNFKQHKDSIVHLEKGLNIIHGESNHGKSNIWNGVKWLFSSITSTASHMVGPYDDHCYVKVVLSRGDVEDVDIVEKYSEKDGRKNVFYVNGEKHLPSNNRVPPEVRRLDPHVTIEVNGNKYVPQVYEQNTEYLIMDTNNTDRIGLCLWGTDISPLEQMKKDLHKEISKNMKELETKKESLRDIDKKIDELSFVKDWRNTLATVKIKKVQYDRYMSTASMLGSIIDIDGELSSLPDTLPTPWLDSMINELELHREAINILDAIDHLDRSMPDPVDIPFLDGCIESLENAKNLLSFSASLAHYDHLLESLPHTTPLVILDDAIDKYSKLGIHYSIVGAYESLEKQIEALPDLDVQTIDTHIMSLESLSKAMLTMTQLISIEESLQGNARDIELSHAAVHELEHDINGIDTCPTCKQKVEEWSV